MDKKSKILRLHANFKIQQIKTLTIRQKIITIFFILEGILLPFFGIN